MSEHHQFEQVDGSSLLDNFQGRDDRPVSFHGSDEEPVAEGMTIAIVAIGFLVAVVAVAVWVALV